MIIIPAKKTFEAILWQAIRKVSLGVEQKVWDMKNDVEDILPSSIHFTIFNSYYSSINQSICELEHPDQYRIS